MGRSDGIGNQSEVGKESRKEIIGIFFRSSPSTSTSHLTMSIPVKRQKRDDYRRQLQEQQEDDKNVKMPQKRFFRQRAHANPFSDHKLE